MGTAAKEKWGLSADKSDTTLMSLRNRWPLRKGLITLEEATHMDLEFLGLSTVVTMDDNENQMVNTAQPGESGSIGGSSCIHDALQADGV